MAKEGKPGAQDSIKQEHNGGGIPRLLDAAHIPLLPEERVAIDQEHLAAPIRSPQSKFQLVPEFLKVRGLVKQHLDSFNYFVNVGIKKIVRANERLTTSDPNIYLKYRDVRIGKPLSSGGELVLTPHICRQANFTYAAPILVDIEYICETNGQKSLKVQKGVNIGLMPVMLRSCCCQLYEKDEEELAKLGECPLDPGGYFIIKGNEKVLLMQEQLAKNRIIIDMDKKKRLYASVQSSTATYQSKTIVVMDKDKIYVSSNQFKTQVPVMVVMKAMGMETDQEVVQMIGRDPRYGDLLFPSIEECASLGVHTKKEALDFLKKKLQFPNPRFKENEQVENILRDVYIGFVPARHNFRAKCIYTAVMMRRMMEAILNKDAMDDKVSGFSLKYG
uniref:DNA-directed RNA polymerase n=1 Tax=Kalanchoe fedtschenkoi TaxID=63787 RepID=A0A7N0U280_KALFE